MGSFCADLPAGHACGGVDEMYAPGTSGQSACAFPYYTSYDNSGRMECCASGVKATAVYEGWTVETVFCAGLPADTYCGGVDTFCASGGCAADTLVCL
eukprot:scaffold6030_cov199-Amphora_coffeaeformis.AAC.12